MYCQILTKGKLWNLISMIRKKTGSFAPAMKKDGVCGLNGSDACGGGV